MRIIELILVMFMFFNTLDSIIADKEVQMKEEKSEDINVQRKLQEKKTNYVTLILNKDFDFTINNKSIIEKVINNGKEEDLSQEIKVIKDTEIQIHFNTQLSDCSNFFRDIDETIKDKIVSIDLSKFDSSNLEKIDSMFNGCSSLESINLSNFNTSKVKSMGSLFYKCSSLKKLDLSSFNTSRVTVMSNLFYYCSSLEKLNLSNFNTSSVTDMNGKFI